MHQSCRSGADAMAIVNGKVIEILELLQRFGEAHLQQKSELHGLFGEAQWYQFPNFQLEGLHRFPLVSTGFRQGSHRSSIPGAGTAARCTVEDSSSYHIYKSLLSIYHINLSNLSIYVWL